MANKDIKEAIQKANIKYWQVADKYGISDCTFSKRLRKELSEVEKEKILKIVNSLSKEN